MWLARLSDRSRERPKGIADRSDTDASTPVVRCATSRIGFLTGAKGRCCNYEHPRLFKEKANRRDAEHSVDCRWRRGAASGGKHRRFLPEYQRGGRHYVGGHPWLVDDSG